LGAESENLRTISSLKAQLFALEDRVGGKDSTRAKGRLPGGSDTAKGLETISNECSILA
jgi:hypothetical protein